MPCVNNRIYCRICQKSYIARNSSKYLKSDGHKSNVTKYYLYRIETSVRHHQHQSKSIKFL